MKKPAIIFDLDGTLTDSGEGIFNCVQLALRHFGLPCEDREALRVFIGPPMRETFPKFGVREDQVEEALAIFRSRYNRLLRLFFSEAYRHRYSLCGMCVNYYLSAAFFQESPLLFPNQ